MRAAIAQVYPGWKWKDKVARMADDQVIAVYYKFAGTGFKPKTKPVEPPAKPAPKKEPPTTKPVGGCNYVQPSLFDILTEVE